MSEMTDELPDPEHPPNVAADLGRGAAPDDGAAPLERLLDPEDLPGQ